MAERDEDRGILGPTWSADHIARAEARDAEALAPCEPEVEPVAFGEALLVWIVLGLVLWSLGIGLVIGLVLMVRVALGWL